MIRLLSVFTISLFIAFAVSHPIHPSLQISSTLQIDLSAFKPSLRLDTSSRGVLRPGVTLDECETDDDCLGKYTCDKIKDGFLSKKDHIPCPKGAKGCFCFPPDGVQFCQAHADCTETRELCASISGIKPFCTGLAAATAEVSTILPRQPGDDDRPNNDALGKTLYPCRDDSVCQADRLCQSVESTDFIKNRKNCTKADAKKGECICLPPAIEPCRKNAECEEGEICGRVKFLKQHGSFCFTADIEGHDLFISASDDVPNQSPVPSPTPRPSPSASASSIPEPSQTQESSPEGSTPATPDAASPSAAPSPAGSQPSAAPSPEESEPSTTPQPSDEVSTAEGGDGSASPSPSSEELSPSPTEDPICIDARALKHLDKNDLVFKINAKATVLCDSNGSCATKGHMVIYNGTAMMMRTYCVLNECSEHEMEVNSPKYRRGMRVNSNTAGLHFTSFAARYATKAEEVVIKMVVHAGF